MKRSILIFCLLLADISAFAQNIVPNSSFEFYGTCPDAFTPFSNVTGWSTYRETPDYFNSCAASGSWSGMPSGGFGYQHSASGNAYAGICTHGTQGSDTVFREYIGRQLSTTLNVGQKYYVNFKVSLADRNSFYCATNNLGVMFSTIPYNSTHPAPIRNYAQVNTTTIITDTTHWTTISGTVIADSAYSYIIIGNFFDNQHSSIIKLNSTTTPCVGYYFVDDICVSTDSITCNGITGITEFYNENLTIKAYPNPAQQSFNIELPNQQTFNLFVYDVTGKKIYQRTNATGTTKIDCSNFNTGIYFVQAVNEKMVLSCKFIKPRLCIRKNIRS
jgi:hypothetical protein